MHREIAIDSEAKILRDKYTKKARLDILTDGVWRLYAGISFNSIDMSTPILEGCGSGIFPLGIDIPTRLYFKLVIFCLIPNCLSKERITLEILVEYVIRKDRELNGEGFFGLMICRL